ncbi:metal-dependent hydrolase [Thalassotalea sp. PLHSN55]|uniref:metal-dependent hydrolase n=1 Tax=Thalassotalea sp. PLHSN55 TaxID=3435888 RepID=UPI003F83DD9A
MPFTPIHMGPGILIKSLLQGSFSLMVFGWTQIIMDIQPLIVLLSGEGHLHGFTHTYVGAILIAIFAALTGKYLSELGLKILKISKTNNLISIAWWVVFLSAFIGSFSHVLLDSIMHADVEPFFPFTLDNKFLGLISVSVLHKLCLYTGLVGAAIYYGINWKMKMKRKL